MELSKEIIEKAFEAIEVAKTTGKRKKGINEVTKVIEKGIAKLVVVAKDINPAEIIMHIKPLCEDKGIPCVEVSSREELGTAAGIQRPTSVVAVLQEGEARGLIKEITEKVLPKDHVDHVVKKPVAEEPVKEKKKPAKKTKIKEEESEEEPVEEEISEE